MNYTDKFRFLRKELKAFFLNLGGALINVNPLLQRAIPFHIAIGIFLSQKNTHSERAKSN